MFVSSTPKQSKNTPSNDLNINLIIMIQNSKVYFAFFLKKEKKKYSLFMITGENGWQIFFCYIEIASNNKAALWAVSKV